MSRHRHIVLLLFLSGSLLANAAFGQGRPRAPVQIGVNIQEVDHPDAKRLNVRALEGAAIVKVFPGTPAERAGLQAGDVVIKCGDHAVAKCDDLRAVILRSKPGDKHRLELFRGNQRYFVHLIVGEPPLPPSQAAPNAARLPYLAMRAVSAGTPSAHQMGIESPYGAAVENVVPDGPAAKAGIGRGDLIVAFAGQEITSYEDIAAALARCAIGSVQRVALVRNNRRMEVRVVIGSRPAGEFPSGEPSAKTTETHQAPTSSSQTAEPPQSPPDGWITKTVGELTISLPPDWTQSEFTAVDEGLWYQGPAILPDASFSIARTASTDELHRGGKVTGVTETAVGGIKATCSAIDIASADAPEKGLVVVVPKRKPEDATLALTCFASAARWKQDEPVFRKILACIRIGQSGVADSK